MKAAATSLVAETACAWAQSALTLRVPSHETFDPERVRDGIRTALDSAGLEAAGQFDFVWEPHGLSAWAFGDHFRLVVHTWPEHGLATLDVAVAGARDGVDRVLKAFEARLGWRRTEEARPARLEGRPA